MERRLLKKLENLRILMNEIAERKGIDDPRVLRISQEIDRVHNQLNRLLQENAPNQDERVSRLKQREDDQVKETSGVFYAKPIAVRVI